MARRKEHTHEEIHDMAIKSVMEYLQTAQLESLSLRKIATQIGYAPSTLINIFGSYQHLLLSVSEQVLTDLYQQLTVSVETASDQDVNLANNTNVHNIEANKARAIEAIEIMAHSYFQFANDHPACFKLVFELSAPEGVELSSKHKLAIDTLFNLISEQLNVLFAETNHEDIVLMSRVLWGGIHGLTCLAIDGKLFTEQAALPAMLSSHVRGYLLGMTQEKDSSCC
ncbi:WHG domain-containing protein [Shewanella olleyana]|uniref:TetR/AcrR family transcriptional regulator n=1 Tax=Shewanella olleyana TaxID=135626 RepID=UPI00200BBDF0|nr:TetR-like C-terminal domain-containing protein [Shewanella olleyana]MCL1067783.1 WHG domain-containing protein [Shewanella olleyana]